MRLIRTFVALLCFAYIAQNLLADSKWIPIEPIKPIEPILINQQNQSNQENQSNKKRLPDINLSQVAPLQQLHQNAKIFQLLLENIKEEPQEE